MGRMYARSHYPGSLLRIGAGIARMEKEAMITPLVHKQVTWLDGAIISQNGHGMFHRSGIVERTEWIDRDIEEVVTQTSPDVVGEA